MPTFVIYSREKSIFEANAPSKAGIASAMRSASFSDPQWGSWVGPAPRVTLMSVVGDGFYTAVAWMYQIPDTAWGNEHATFVMATLKTNVDAAMHRLSSDFTPVTVYPYSEALHGSVSWWQTGIAARTRDTFPAGTDRLLPPENPVGPAVTTPGALDVLKPLMWGAVAASVGITVYYIGPILQRITGTDSVSQGIRARRELESSTRAAARSNPRRSRRRSR